MMCMSKKNCAKVVEDAGKVKWNAVCDPARDAEGALAKGAACTADGDKCGKDAKKQMDCVDKKCAVKAATPAKIGKNSVAVGGACTLQVAEECKDGKCASLNLDKKLVKKQCVKAADCGGTVDVEVPDAKDAKKKTKVAHTVVCEDGAMAKITVSVAAAIATLASLM